MKISRSSQKNAATAATETITNSIGMKLKLISPGEFVMGSPEAEEKRDDRETQHRVQITRSFYMGVDGSHPTPMAECHAFAPLARQDLRSKHSVFA